MTKQLSAIVTFYKKNRILIISVLAILAVLQWCQTQANKKYRSNQPQNIERTIEAPISAPQIAPPSNEKPGYNPWLPYLLMVGLTLLIFIAQRRGWFLRLMPRRVVLRVKIFEFNKRMMLRIFFMNSKSVNQDFDSPVVEFMKPGKIKSFKLIVSDSDVSFPITLTTGTAHSLVIDLEKFYDKMPELKSYHWLRIRLVVNGGEVKRSWPQPVWATFFKR